MPTIPAVSALPDLFTLHDGHKVLTADDWRRRRAELLEMIQDIEYGHLPPKPEKITIHALNAFAPFQEQGLKGINGMHYRLVAEPYGGFHDGQGDQPFRARSFPGGDRRRCLLAIPFRRYYPHGAPTRIRPGDFQPGGACARR
ncbi:MAG TPA: hypothetical protein VHV83_02550 [Armatimonadota bacterium]|nr:hypothetical protein [Armatimonadota bacterium]